MIKQIFASVLMLVMCICCCGYVPLTSDTKYYCDTTYLETGSSDQTISSISFDYDYYTLEDVHLDMLCPIYRNLTQENSCAPFAGSVLVGYYDFYCPNLLPNYESFYYYNGYKFKPQNTQVIAMKEYLYELMGTNSINPGTSVAQFKTGMTSFAQEKGYNITFNSCGTINVTSVKSYLQQQKPIVIFMNSYKYSPFNAITIGDISASMSILESNNGHVMTAYGYREYKYYQDGVNFRTDRYLLVVFGDGTDGLIDITNTSRIDDSYAVTIY